MNDNISLVKQLNIVMFSREGCPWCEKAKEVYTQDGVLELIKVVDITKPEGRLMADKLLPLGNIGTPSFVSLVTKKTALGFMSIEKLIKIIDQNNCCKRQKLLVNN